MEENNNINVNETGTEETGAENQEQKTYTQEEVLKLIQSETDKRVNQALATQRKKHEKELSLSKLDGEARAQAEKDQRIAELEERLAQVDIERNKSELKTVLGSRGLSAEFADIIIINDDLEASQANIDKLDKLFKAAVRAEVEKRLAATGGNVKGNGGNTAEYTKENAKNMSLAEISALMKNNPELYNKLFN